MMRNELLNRTLPFLSEDGANNLKDKTVVIAGCGGVGGISALALARMGVGNFRLADPGVFDPPDANRQIGATCATMGMNKANVYASQIKDINPDACVESYSEGVTEYNVSTLVEGADFLIDCLDLSVTTKLRSDVFSYCRQHGVMVSCTPMIGFGGAIFISDPNGMSLDWLFDNLIGNLSDGKFVFASYFKKYFTPEHLHLVEEWIQTKKTKVPSVAISPMLISGFLCTEIINHFIGDVMPAGRKATTLPNAVFFDPFKLCLEIVDVSGL